MKHQATAVFYEGIEYDIVHEGSSPYQWYQVCRVLHRNAQGKIDYYLRLQGYGLPRYKKDALVLLTEIVEKGPKMYKEPQRSRKAKYVLRYNLAQVSYNWITGKQTLSNPATTRRYYHIVEIDNPDALTQYQIEKEYWGPEMQGIPYKELFDRGKIAAIAQTLNKRYWQQRKAEQTPMHLEVDLRPYDEREEYPRGHKEKEETA